MEIGIVIKTKNLLAHKYAALRVGVKLTVVERTGDMCTINIRDNTCKKGTMIRFEKIVKRELE